MRVRRFVLTSITSILFTLPRFTAGAPAPASAPATRAAATRPASAFAPLPPVDPASLAVISLDEAISKLQGDKRDRAKALSYIARNLDESRRSEVAAILEKQLASAHDDVLPALEKWVVPANIAALEKWADANPKSNYIFNAYRAIAKTRDPKVVDYLMSRCPNNQEVLKELGPVAENALLATVPSKMDFLTFFILEDCGGDKTIAILQKNADDLKAAGKTAEAKTALDRINLIRFRTHTDEVAAEYVARLTGPDGRACEDALHIFSKTKPTEKSRALISAAVAKLLDDPKFGLPGQAIQALCVWGLPEDIEPRLEVIGKLASTGNSTYRWNAMDCLAHCKSPGALSKLIASMHALPLVPNYADRLISFGPSAEDPLIENLPGLKGQAIVETAWALSTIGSQKSIPVLKNIAATDSESTIRKEAHAAAALLAKRLAAPKKSP